MPNDIINKARQLRAYIEEQSVNLSDTEALDLPEAFPEWDGYDEGYQVGDRIRFDGKLYKCLQNHRSQPTWRPDQAYSLWAEVLITGDEDAPPEWQQPGADNAYMSHDRVTYNGLIYESLIDNNVWSPDAYPDGWQLID